ncbi:MAG: MarR family transcriptional regulator [Syntrophotaleaceae bacterium]
MSGNHTHYYVAPTSGAQNKSAGVCESRIVRSLRRIVRGIELHSRKLVIDHQITGPQLACLLALQAEEPLTVKKLAQQAFLSPSTVVGIVDRLEEKGLVKRCRSCNDRRSVFITVTEAGHRLLAAAPSPIQESLTHAIKGLPEEEMVAITIALEKVVDLMESFDCKGDPPPLKASNNGISDDVSL